MNSKYLCTCEKNLSMTLYVKLLRAQPLIECASRIHIFHHHYGTQTEKHKTLKRSALVSQHFVSDFMLMEYFLK